MLLEPAPPVKPLAVLPVAALIAALIALVNNSCIVGNNSVYYKKRKLVTDFHSMFYRIEFDNSMDSPPFTPMISPFTPRSQFRSLITRYDENNEVYVRNDVVDITNSGEGNDENDETPKGCCLWFRRRNAK